MDDSLKENKDANPEKVFREGNVHEPPPKRMKTIVPLANASTTGFHKPAPTITGNNIDPSYFLNLPLCKNCNKTVYSCKCKLANNNGPRVIYKVFRKPRQTAKGVEIKQNVVKYTFRPPRRVPEKQYQPLERICELHHKYCEYTEERRRGIGRREFEFTVNSRFDTLTNRIVAWKHYAKDLEKDIEWTGTFIQWLDNDLEASDRAILLERHFFEIHLLKIFRALSFNGLHLPDGRLIDFPTLGLLYGFELANAMIMFAKQLLEWKMTDDDIAALILLVFYRLFAKGNSTEIELENPQHATQLFLAYQTRFISRCSYRNEEQKYGKISKLLSKINEINKMHKEVEVFLKNHHENFSDDSYFKTVYVKMLSYEKEAKKNNRDGPAQSVHNEVITLD